MPLTSSDFKDITVTLPTPTPNAATVLFGKPFPAQQQILIYESGEWEKFIDEWVQSQKVAYESVVRFAGAGDMGIDIAGFTDEKYLNGVWDSFQCKHYDQALKPGKTAVEMGKIIWYSFKNEYAPPRKHYFIAPKNCGNTLTKLLLDPPKLKEYIRDTWNDNCADKITKTERIVLSDEFLVYFEKFDFSIFSFKRTLDIIEDHKKTQWHAVRFGGGLAKRPPVSPPPTEIAKHETRYTEQLFEAYSDHKRLLLKSEKDIQPFSVLKKHFDLQRESFYHAEALRNFARDNVPPGTFEELQEEIFDGVNQVALNDHADSFVRINEVCRASHGLQLTANSLISVLKIKDRTGVCHQLANVDKLIWKK